MKVVKAFLASAIPLLCGCFRTNGAPIPTINGEPYACLTVKWKKGHKNMDIYIEKNVGYFSFNVDVLKYGDNGLETERYSFDSGFFVFDDSTGEKVIFETEDDEIAFKHKGEYCFKGARTITVTFNQFFLDEIDSAKRTDFIINGCSFSTAFML